MKTAISIPDPVFRKGEKLAKRLKMSRSQLYATALESYLKERPRGNITERLNAVYGHERSRLDPVLARLQTRVFRRENW